MKDELNILIPPKFRSFLGPFTVPAFAIARFVQFFAPSGEKNDQHHYTQSFGMFRVDRGRSSLLQSSDMSVLPEQLTQEGQPKWLSIG
jgi:hypothetical protein